MGGSTRHPISVHSQKKFIYQKQIYEKIFLWRQMKVSQIIKQKRAAPQMKAVGNLSMKIGKSGLN